MRKTVAKPLFELQYSLEDLKTAENAIYNQKSWSPGPTAPAKSHFFQPTEGVPPRGWACLARCTHESFWNQTELLLMKACQFNQPQSKPSTSMGSTHSSNHWILMFHCTPGVKLPLGWFLSANQTGGAPEWPNCRSPHLLSASASFVQKRVKASNESKANEEISSKNRWFLRCMDGFWWMSTDLKSMAGLSSSSSRVTWGVEPSQDDLLQGATRGAVKSRYPKGVKKVSKVTQLNPKKEKLKNHAELNKLYQNESPCPVEC